MKELRDKMSPEEELALLDQLECPPFICPSPVFRRGGINFPVYFPTRYFFFPDDPERPKNELRRWTLEQLREYPFVKQITDIIKDLNRRYYETRGRYAVAFMPQKEEAAQWLIGKKSGGVALASGYVGLGYMSWEEMYVLNGLVSEQFDGQLVFYYKDYKVTYVIEECERDPGAWKRALASPEYCEGLPLSFA